MVLEEVIIQEGRRISIEGTVQGVGFRPFVYGLAQRFQLCGRVSNVKQGVVVDVEGSCVNLKGFLDCLRAELPPLAKITALRVEKVSPWGFPGFSIVEAIKEDLSVGDSPPALLPPDVATCPVCLAEVQGRRERRYRYPFTNCTQCGPRFTIVYKMPYDRGQTSMDGFPLCPSCRREYKDPSDRRFHAQPIACPGCGPEVSLVDRKGKIVPGDWLEQAWEALRKGKIIAVKGLGGFHLICDAKNSAALARLRKRKNRPAKPFAVMARDAETAKKYCHIDAAGEKLLTDSSSPIVTFIRRERGLLSEGLAPGLKTLGVMLPYTPLHHLLFAGKTELLVITSGNLSGLPLVIENEAALMELGPVVDLVFVHNRDIVNRCDDSVVAPPKGRGEEGLPAIFMRRARGYVPGGIRIPISAGKTVLGCGGDFKNTFCILKGDNAFLSQHLGDMGHLEGQSAFKESYQWWCSYLDVQPSVVGYDPHPGYAISRVALEYSWENKYSVQHHHAHMAAVMGEHGLQEEVLAAILDGSGYGRDGCIWGFEIFKGDYTHAKRLYHMRYLPLIGGEKAVREPWRPALALLHQGGGASFALKNGVALLQRREREIRAALHLMESSFPTPLASSGGRLFDAAAALLGLCQENTYEGEAAIRLSELVVDMELEAGALTLPAYPYTIKEGALDFSPVFLNIAYQVRRGEDKRFIAWRFHLTLTRAVVDLLLLARKRTGLNTVVLGGGVFQNRVLLLLCKRNLLREGFRVYHPEALPPNDGALSLGQALVAASNN